MQLSILRSLSLHGMRASTGWARKSVRLVVLLEVGCHCEDESRCHHEVLRKLLTEQGADVR